MRCTRIEQGGARQSLEQRLDRCRQSDACRIAGVIPKGWDAIHDTRLASALREQWRDDQVEMSEGVLDDRQWFRRLPGRLERLAGVETRRGHCFNLRKAPQPAPDSSFGAPFEQHAAIVTHCNE